MNPQTSKNASMVALIRMATQNYKGPGYQLLQKRARCLPPSGKAWYQPSLSCVKCRIYPNRLSLDEQDAVQASAERMVLKPTRNPITPKPLPLPTWALQCTRRDGIKDLLASAQSRPSQFGGVQTSACKMGLGLRVFVVEALYMAFGKNQLWLFTVRLHDL